MVTRDGSGLEDDSDLSCAGTGSTDYLSRRVEVSAWMRFCPVGRFRMVRVLETEYIGGWTLASFVLSGPTIYFLPGRRETPLTSDDLPQSSNSTSKPSPPHRPATQIRGGLPRYGLATLSLEIGDDRRLYYITRTGFGTIFRPNSPSLPPQRTPVDTTTPSSGDTKLSSRRLYEILLTFAGPGARGRIHRWIDESFRMGLGER